MRNALIKEGKLKGKDDDRLNAAIADFQHQFKAPGK